MLSDDPDLPYPVRWTSRLHAAFGRALIGLSARLKRPISLGVRLLATNAEGQVLLVRHTYVPGHMLPGGGVEIGETCKEAVMREAYEEAGLVFDAPPKLFHVYLNRVLANRDHVVLFVTEGAHQVDFARSGEIQFAGFFDPGNLPEDTTPATRMRLREVLEGISPSDVW